MMSKLPVDPPLLHVKAGFPNPAEDRGGYGLDIAQLLIQHPISTFYLRVSGNEMSHLAIRDGDIVVVDRSLASRHHDIVVAVVENDLVIRRLHSQGNATYLMRDDNQSDADNNTQEVVIWGVVTYTIHQQRGSHQ